MVFTTEQWKYECERRNAFWKHDGNPKRPHVLLTPKEDGRTHSDGYFNGQIVTKDQTLLPLAVLDLVDILLRGGAVLRNIDAVVAPDSEASCMLATRIAEQISRDSKNGCYHYCPQKTLLNGKNIFVFSDDQRAYLYGQRVIICDDVITSGGTIELIERAMKDLDVKILPVILSVVNRSGRSEINGKKVVSLITENMATWTPDECELCPKGSPVLPAKDNWERLNAKYPS